MSEELQESTQQESTQSDSGAETMTQDAVQTEQTVQDSEDTFTKFDLKSLDEKIRPEAEKAYKSFQSDYTKKTQSLAEERRRVAAEVDAVKRQYAELQAQATRILRDPQEYEAARKLYGPQLGVNAAPEIPKLETTEDLVKYVEGRESLVARQAEQRMEQKLKSFQSQQRWEDVLRNTRTDPIFKQYEEHIVQLAQLPENVNRFRSGELDEKGVIEKALNDFKNIIKAERENGKQQGLGVNQKKKQAMTTRPGKSVSTEPAATLSREEIISRVRQRIG